MVRRKTGQAEFLTCALLADTVSGFHCYHPGSVLSGDTRYSGQFFINIGFWRKDKIFDTNAQFLVFQHFFHAVYMIRISVC